MEMQREYPRISGPSGPQSKQKANNKNYHTREQRQSNDKHGKEVASHGGIHHRDNEGERRGQKSPLRPLSNRIRNVE